MRSQIQNNKLQLPSRLSLHTVALVVGATGILIYSINRIIGGGSLNWVFVSGLVLFMTALVVRIPFAQVLASLLQSADAKLFRGTCSQSGQALRLLGDLCRFLHCLLQSLSGLLEHAPSVARSGGTYRHRRLLPGKDSTTEGSEAVAVNQHGRCLRLHGDPAIRSQHRCRYWTGRGRGHHGSSEGQRL